MMMDRWCPPLAFKCDELENDDDEVLDEHRHGRRKHHDQQDGVADGKRPKTADHAPELVPITIDCDNRESDGRRLRDTFCWSSASDDYESFAHTLCADMGLPLAVFGPQIVAQLRKQVVAFRHLQHHRAVVAADPRAGEDPARLDTLHIAVRLGGSLVTDSPAWAGAKLGSGAEDYASRLATDLGLGAESVPAIAHAARAEAVRVYREAAEAATGEKRPGPRGRPPAPKGAAPAETDGAMGAAAAAAVAASAAAVGGASLSQLYGNVIRPATEGREPTVDELTAAEALALDAEDEKRAARFKDALAQLESFAARTARRAARGGDDDGGEGAAPGVVPPWPA